METIRTRRVARGYLGCYAPLANVKVLKKALTVYEGTLAFDLTGKRDTYEIIDFCVDKEETMKAFEHVFDLTSRLAIAKAVCPCGP